VAEDGQRAAVLGEVERMIELLAEPLRPPPTLRARIAEWWPRKRNSRRGWRQVGRAILEEVRKQLLGGEAAVDAGAMEGLLWWLSMGKAEGEINGIWSVRGGYLEAETDEFRSLASSIWRGMVELRERTTEPVARASMVQELFVDDAATPGEAVAVEEAFAHAGFLVTVQRGLLPTPWDAERWTVVGTIRVPIPAFFAAFTDDGTKETSAAVKRWADEISQARGVPGGRPRGEIMLHGRLDTDVILSSDMPEAAFESLFELDLGFLTQGATVASDTLAADLRWHLHTLDRNRYFKWDAAQNEWFDQWQRHRSRSRWRRSNPYLLSLIGLVVAGLAGLRRRRRAD
jgi:hypothetical protein